VLRLIRNGDSCGYAVPRMDYVEDRDQLVRWAETKGDDALDEYRVKKNSRGLGGQF
jgi:hypothetical protein